MQAKPLKTWCLKEKMVRSWGNGLLLIHNILWEDNCKNNSSKYDISNVFIIMNDHFKRFVISAYDIMIILI